MRRVRKVKIDNRGKIIIDWEVKAMKDGGWDEYHMKCSDLANPEFYDAMGALVQDILTLCEFPTGWKNSITVHSVSFSYSDDDVKGAVITGQRELEHSSAPLNLNTPHKPYEPYNPEQGDVDPDMLLPEETCERLDILDDEANKYIDGDRAQGNLFKELEKEAAKADKRKRQHIESIEDMTGIRPQL
jgi:hypothetical protein